LLDISRENPVVVAEYSQPNAATAVYTYGGELISQRRGGDESFYLMDGHSGVRILTDAAGNLTDTSSYDAFGNAIDPLSSEFSYRGESFDDLTGLQYLRARYYDPSNGRFLSTDAFEGVLESPVSRHRYLYGNANPVTYLDPSGNISSTLELGAAFSISTILYGLSVVGVAQAALAITSEQDTNWDGKLVVEGKVSLLDYKPLKFDGYYLEATTRKEFFYKSINASGRFRGYWAILTVGSSIVPSSATFSPPIEVKTDSSVKLFSPSWAGANQLTLAGAVSWGKIKSFGLSGSIFTIGFGKGYSLSGPALSPDIGKPDEKTMVPYVGLDGFVGVSVPVGLGEVL
jgi:RHS repeat-associated protein